MEDLNKKNIAWARGNQSAAEFLGMMGGLSQEIDDIFDGDGGSIINVVSELIIMTTCNQFFLDHREKLTGLLLSSLTMWSASNEFAKSTNETTQIYGFVYREVLEQIIPFVSMLCGADIDEAKNVAVDVHAYYHQKMKQDTFADWNMEVSHGKH